MLSGQYVCRDKPVLTTNQLQAQTRGLNTLDSEVSSLRMDLVCLLRAVSMVSAAGALWELKDVHKTMSPAAGEQLLVQQRKPAARKLAPNALHHLIIA